MNGDAKPAPIVHTKVPKWRNFLGEPAVAKGIVFLLGTLLIGAGAFWIYKPAGLITIGALLILDTIINDPSKRGR